ncbi:Fibronectin type III domain-containing protein [Ruania alba]|uniref:Fibronectin type III domain-containing protein n=1 Tax=Ruania alba TaxID=648782 RepID=A0A1H5HGV0_9MICO|nr:Fibronectin type III domain-containing protein [Ruania alba]
MVLDVLANDTDPDGSAERLTVQVTAGQENARSDDGETVTVTLAPTRQVVTYRVTDEDDLTSYAFIEVPGTEDTGPVLRPDTEVIEVLAGEPETIQLNDYVVALSGQPVQLSDSSSVRATNSDGSSPVVDTDTLQYTSDPNYVGPATLTFEVTDAEDINDDDILTSVLTLDIMVVSNENQPPRMRDGSVEAEQGGEAVTLDIARLAEDPDGRSTDLEYRIAEEADGFEASLEDYILTVTADEDTPAGSSQDLVIEVTDGESDPVRAVVVLSSTSSNRPLISTNPDDAGEIEQGDSVSVPVLANDSNPFSGEPREITAAEITAGSGAVSVEGDQVVLTPAADFVGRLTATYTVVDVTGEPDRAVEGQITAAVLGVPEAPTIPLIEEVASGEVTLSWTAPEDNGASISGYTVTYGSGSQACPTTTCTITGLANGTGYTFSVTATNAVGDSPASPASAEAIPDVRPEAPRVVYVSAGDEQLEVSWANPVNEGTPITSYDVQISPGDGAGQRSVTGNSLTWTGLTNGESYTFRVRAINDAPNPGAWSEWSAPIHPYGPPFQPEAPQAVRIDDAAGGRIQVTWTSPDDNGDPVWTYHVRMYRDGQLAHTFTPTGGGNSREVQVENGHDYSFAVAATNRAGRGDFSARSEPLRSFGAPGAPTNVTASATGQDNTAEVSYSAPNNNGQAIGRYEYRLNGGSVQSLSSNNRITVAQDGQSYRIEVRACNSYCGGWSGASPTFSTHGPPGNGGISIDSSADGQTVTFDWSVPNRNNGADLTATRYSINGDSWNVVTGRTGSASVTGGWETIHTIRVQVRNEHGQWSGTRSGGPYAEDRQISDMPQVVSPPSVTMLAMGDAQGATSADGSCVSDACHYLGFEHSGFVAGDYHVAFHASQSGTPYSEPWREADVTLTAGSGDWQSQWFRGNPGEQVRVVVTGPSGTFEDTITWPSS